MHNKCNTLESVPNHPLLPSVKKSSFLKLVPGAKKVVLGQWKPQGLRVWIPLPPLACCVIPGKSFNLPDPQSLYLYYRDGYSCFTGQLWGQESTCVESLVVVGGMPSPVGHTWKIQKIPEILRWFLYSRSLLSAHLCLTSWWLPRAPPQIPHTSSHHSSGLLVATTPSSKDLLELHFRVAGPSWL